MNGTEKYQMIRALKQRLKDRQADDFNNIDLIYHDKAQAALLKCIYQMGMSMASAEFWSVIGRLCDEE